MSRRLPGVIDHIRRHAAASAVLADAGAAPRPAAEGGRVMHPVNLTIGAPAAFMNANHRHHWSRKGRDTKAWRTAAWAHARSENLAPRDRRARVIVVFHRTGRRRCDVGNLAPTAKAIVDGLTDAGLWPDDSDAHLVGPDLRAGEPWPRPGVEVFIEDAKEEAA